MKMKTEMGGIRTAVLAAAILAAGACALAKDAPKAVESDVFDPAESLAIIRAVQPALVQVEYTLRYDKGQSPNASGGYRSGSASTALEEERPLVAPGFLVSPKKVVSTDRMIHPRFIKSICVRFNGKTVKAKIAAYGTIQNAMFLELAEPLKGAKPLVFKPKTDGPYKTVSYWRIGGSWKITVRSLSTLVVKTDTGRKFRVCRPSCLIVDEKGVPVAISMNDELPVDNSWKTSPAKWDIVPARREEKILKDIEGRTKNALLRVELGFRSPKKRPGESPFGGGDTKTEQNALALLVDPDTVVVLISLTPKVTARLERIRVHAPDGKIVQANFLHSMKDYGCFLAKLKTPLSQPIELGTEKITKYFLRLLPTAEVTLHGDKQTRYFMRTRIVSYSIGWRGKIFPSLPTYNEERQYVFSPAGRLIAFPLIRRPKPGSDEGRWGGKEPTLTPASHLRDALANLPKNIDPGNVPLSEAEENRLAWMGVVLQPLNQELARVNKVSELTDDGETGALVSYVYPNSPAAKHGITVGDILLRLHVKGRVKPIEVKISQYGFSGRRFPWEHLGNLPERYFDRIPTPWPPVENELTRTLTDLGFGKEYELEIFSAGKVTRKKFKVIEGPKHYKSAGRFKSKDLGLTVADMTYEVRRYFHKNPDDPGVVISKIEPGSKASVSGLKPYEVITHVNDQAVHSAKEFGKLLKNATELRLSVKRWTRGRVVKLRLGGAKKKTATQPASSPVKQPAKQPTSAPAG